VDGDGSQQNDAGSSPRADDSAADVVEQGGRPIFPSLNWPSMNWRPPRGAAILLAVGLIIGLAAGYAAGYRQAPRNATALPTPSSGSAPPLPAPVLLPTSVTFRPVEGTGAVITGGLALIQDTGACSAQIGRELQLGVQVTNRSAQAIGLGQIRTVLPLGGLRVISQQWAPCGAIGVSQDPASLGPGDSAWFSVTVQVLVACPGPLPVEFTVGYTWAGKAAVVHLPGFPDLGKVSYPGCTGS
jgi:hypothetical protein